MNEQLLLTFESKPIVIESGAYVPRHLAERLQAVVNNVFSHFSKTRFERVEEVISAIDKILKLIKEQKEDFDWYDTYSGKV